MAEVFENAALILLFILVGGVFSAAEMALVSAAVKRALAPK